MLEMVDLSGNLPDNVTVDDLEAASEAFDDCSNVLYGTDDFYLLTTPPEKYEEYHEQMIKVMEMSIEWRERGAVDMYQSSTKLLLDIEDELDEADELDKNNGMKDRREELLD